jgi:hypothetical protein
MIGIKETVKRADHSRKVRTATARAEALMQK